MSKQNDLTEQDLKLLEEIEEIVANGGGERCEADSLYGFCAHLTSTVPRADEDFQQRLEARLIASIQQQENRVGKARTPSWLQCLSPDVGRIREIFHVRGGLTMKKAFALAAVAALVVAVGTVLLVPSVRAQVSEAIKRITLGPHSSAEQVEFQEEDTPQPLPPDMWLIDTEIGAYGGNVLPSEDTAVRSTTDFEEAQAATDFHLRAPTDLPEGYALREVKLAPIDGPPWAFLFYGGPGHDIVIVQMSVGPQPSDDPNVAVSVASKFVTNGTLEEVDFDGHLATWVNGHGLMWEVDSICYTVGGLDLDLEQTMQIARSLR